MKPKFLVYKYGTPYFRSENDAIKYYAQYAMEPIEIKWKLETGEIYVGLPPTHRDERVELDSDGRYHVALYK